MSPLLFFLVAAAILLAVEGLNWFGWTQPEAVARGADRYATDIGLDLPPALAPAVARRLAARGRVAAVGGLVGGLGTGWAAAPFVADDPWLYQPLGIVAGSVAGHAIGETVVAWRESRRAVPGGRRVARVTVPTVGDYVRPQERIGGWVMVAAALVAGVVVTGAPGSDALRDTPVGVIAVLLALPLLSVLLAEGTARRLVARPQVADSALALAWDDALRALALRGLVRLPYAATVGVTFVVFLVRGHGGKAVTESPVDWLLMAILVTTAWVPSRQWDVRQFRERLWPVAPSADVAPDAAGAAADADAPASIETDPAL